MTVEHTDVLIVGAGLSGIGAGVHLQRQCPELAYTILEGRERSGGTWDLFRYPGIRSDSDMYTLGFDFRPWTAAKAIADGGSILDYLRKVAADYGVERRIRYRHRVVAARWSTPEARWTVEIERGPERERVTMTCQFLYLCAGYYDYAGGYTPPFPGLADYTGRFVHPQHWPDDLDYRGKKVVVIGSGATAVTLVPAMAKEAAHVTMLQRSPTYIVSLPGSDAIANGLRRMFTPKLAYVITRWKNVLTQMAFFRFCRAAPGLAKKLIRAGVRHQLPKGFDVDRHFSPAYNPWDQRVCLVPDGDLFRALRKGSAAVVTDHIERFTPRGIRLKSGEELEADVVVSATGLKLLALGGVRFEVDGEPVALPERMAYRGMMISGLPNLALAIGYTNASWTLKVDLGSAYFGRLLRHLRERGYRQFTPVRSDPSVQEEPLLDFSSGYVQRAIGDFPKQGSKAPWKLYQNYLLDLVSLRFGKLDDGALEFR